MRVVGNARRSHGDRPPGPLDLEEFGLARNKRLNVEGVDMSLTERQITYRDDLVYEYELLTTAEFGSAESPDVELDTPNVCTMMQDLVDDFRAAHPEASRAVRKGIGFRRRDR